MDDNIVDLAGATERPACGKGLSIIGGDIEGRSITGVEIAILSFIAGDKSSGWQTRYFSETVGMLRAKDSLAGRGPENCVTAGRVSHRATVCCSTRSIVDAVEHLSQQASKYAMS